MAQLSSPPNPDAFNTLVWDIVRMIPRGKVASYGQIAKMIVLFNVRGRIDMKKYGWNGKIK